MLGKFSLSSKKNKDIKNVGHDSLTNVAKHAVQYNKKVQKTEVKQKDQKT